MNKSLILLSGILWSATGILSSQTFIKPNYSLRSHPTLDIVKIEAGPEATVFSMSIGNRIAGGTFCADRNIYMMLPDGKKILLTSASGIPVCPDSYKFKAPGEKLDFVLTFPPLKHGTSWIDLVENCSDNCFSFYGIALDNDLNKRIDDAFTLAENDQPAKALISFINILSDKGDSCAGIKGLLYINIIRLEKETGNNTEAEEWYKKFKSSDTPRLSQYITYLNDQGIRY
ncbi:MAG: hypothetical protein WCE64_10735 [Bacteroidales bacterium]